MNLDAVFELMVVEAALVLVLASFWLERSVTPRYRYIDASFVLLGVLSAGCYVNWQRPGVHAQEQFHSFLGSKYLSELRYDAIYEATILAVGDAGLLPDRQMPYRDPLTFQMRVSPLSPVREAEIRQRFTPERWRAFQQDATKLWYKTMLRDHGNTGSPAWAMAAGVFTRFLPLTHRTQGWLGFLDPLLFMALAATVALTLGVRTAGLAMITGLLIPMVYSYLGGSILRMDWLVALGFSVCLFERRYFRTAGLLLGYAFASKIFVGAMVLPLGLHIAVDTIRRRRLDRDHGRYVVFALGGLVLAVVLSGLFFLDFALWADYLRRLQTTFHEQYYAINHSFRDVFLQIYHMPASAWRPLPESLAAALPTVDIEHVRGAFVAAQLALLVGLGFVAVRNPPRFAFALGPLAVFVLFVSNRYYWQMWMISALALVPVYRESWRAAALLSAILAWIASMHLVQMTSMGVAKGGYFGSYGLLLICAGLVVCEFATWIRERSSVSTIDPKEPQ